MGGSGRRSTTTRSRPPRRGGPGRAVRPARTPRRTGNNRSWDESWSRLAGTPARRRRNGVHRRYGNQSKREEREAVRRAQGQGHVQGAGGEDRQQPEVVRARRQEERVRRQ